MPILRRRLVIPKRDRLRTLIQTSFFSPPRSGRSLFHVTQLKIVVISDIHSNLDALEAIEATLPDYDSLLCLGDVVGYGPQPNEVIEKLENLHPSAALTGNHDHAVVTGDTSKFSELAAIAVYWTREHITPENIHYLSNLQSSLRLECGGIPLALYHGSPRDPLSEYIFPDVPKLEVEKLIRESGADVLLLGHTHVPMVRSFDDKMMLANPGSVGQPRDADPRASYAILTISNERCSFDIRRIEYNMNSVANKITLAGLPKLLGDRLFAGM